MEDVLQILFGILIIWLIVFILLEYKIINDKRKIVKNLFKELDKLFIKRMNLLSKMIDIIKAYDKNQFDDFGSKLYDYINSYEQYEYNKRITINEEIDSEIRKILLVSKVYPELKKVNRYIKLEKQLLRYGKVINKIKAKYNSSLSKYKDRRSIITSRVICSLFKFYNYDYYGSK